MLYHIISYYIILYYIILYYIILYYIILYHIILYYIILTKYITTCKSVVLPGGGLGWTCPTSSKLLKGVAPNPLTYLSTPVYVVWQRH